MFRPLNEDHAIESVKFTLLFTRPIAPKSISAVESHHDLWRVALPAKSRLDVDVDVSGRPVKAPAIMFGFLKPDANPVWSMQVGANQIEIECFLYSRWQRVWETSREHLKNVLGVLAEAQDKLLVSAMHMTVKDTFISDDNTVTAKDLLRQSDKLPQYVFKALGSWNTYFSWLVDEDEDVRTWHASDIEGSFYSDGARVEIVHSQTRNTGVDLPITDVSELGFERLDAMMETMHLSNKGFVSELIVADMGERIGLGRK